MPGIEIFVLPVIGALLVLPVIGIFLVLRGVELFSLFISQKFLAEFLDSRYLSLQQRPDIPDRSLRSNPAVQGNRLRDTGRHTGLPEGARDLRAVDRATDDDHLFEYHTSSPHY